jgi:hypothetical protein
MMEDGLGLPPNSVAAAKTLEPCVGVAHVDGAVMMVPENLLACSK